MACYPSAVSTAPTPIEPLPAGLVYVTDSMPGYSRMRRGSGFAYRDAHGKPLRDPDEVARIRKLAIPPAYTQVWICPKRNGHIQATGIDARGRKQYRYHADWHTSRTESKFHRLEAFGGALPRIRARVARDLRALHPSARSRAASRTAASAATPASATATLTRNVVLATLVRLLDTTFVRVGNDEYARTNGSYGLTTLRNPHATVRGSTLRLSFRGKSGVEHEVSLTDPRVALVVRRCQHLPGQELFGYVDDDGDVRDVDSGDVNEYLAEAAGGERFTAKDFRTWHGTVEALELTRRACEGDAELSSAKHVLSAVARRLGNTPAVCRKAYIHPEVLALGAALGSDDETLRALWSDLEGPARSTRGLRATEQRLLRFLRRATQARRRAEVLARRPLRPDQPKARAARSRPPAPAPQLPVPTRASRSRSASIAT